jgi:polar amino acid transport system substrate-binding protein
MTYFIRCLTDNPDSLYHELSSEHGAVKGFTLFMKKIFILLLTTCTLFYTSLALSQEKATTTTLKVAWSASYPYKYLKIPSMQSSLTGLDIELLKLIAADTGTNLHFTEMNLQATLDALKRGDVDMAAGASYSDERAQYVYYSKPYRNEENALYVLRVKNQNYKFHTVDEFIAYIKEHHFRLGVKIAGILANAKMNSFAKDPANSKYIIPFTDETAALKSLLDNEIDGFIADRIAGSSLVWLAREDTKVAEHTLPMKTTVHFIFSKKTVSPALVQTFDKAIENDKDNPTFRNDFTWYIYPVIMMQATGKAWFKSLDILGAIFFSISGVLIAYSLNKSFLSALLYAILPCMTGGILRDAIFNNRPVEALESPNYLLLICSVVFIGFCISTAFYEMVQHNIIQRKSKIYNYIVADSRKIFKPLLVVCDSMGLATLTVSGVMTSLMARAEPLWLWGPFFAFLTASFGTILRDIISKNERLEDVVGEINSEVGIIWSFFLSLAIIFNANNIQPDFIRDLIFITIAGVFVTRLLIHYFKVPNVYFR